MKLSLQKLEAHLWGVANLLRAKTTRQDDKNDIRSLMFYKRLCDQWECEADEAIAELARQQGRAFTEPSLLAESWNPPYTEFGFDREAANPSFLKAIPDHSAKF